MPQFETEFRVAGLWRAAYAKFELGSILTVGCRIPLLSKGAVFDFSSFELKSAESRTHITSIIWNPSSRPA
jgi:hypothetical protein